jgi:hypothetical protein
LVEPGKGIGWHKVRGAPEKGGSALFRLALSVFETSNKLFEKRSETFGNGSLPHAIAVFPEPLSEERSNLTVGSGF